MKYTKYSTVLLLVITSMFSLLSNGQTKRRFELKCTHKGLEEGSRVYLVRNSKSSKGLDTIVTTKAKEEKFVLTGFLNYEGEEHFIFIRNEGTKKIPNIPVLLESKRGRLVASSDSLIDAKPFSSRFIRSIIISGFPAHDDYRRFKIAELDIYERINKNIQNAVRMNSSEESDLRYQIGLKEIDKFNWDWIENHPSSLYTPWLICTYIKDEEKRRRAYLLLSKKAKKSKWGLELYGLIQREKAVAPGAEFPVFMFPDEKGKQVKLSDYSKTGLYTIVDFWASWCKPCINEFSVLKLLYEKYKNRGLNIIGYSVDKEEDEEKWKKALSENQLVWPNVRQTRSLAKETYNVDKIPANFILDNGGKVVAKNLYGEDIVKRVDSLMGATEWSFQGVLENTTRADVKTKFANVINSQSLKKHIYSLAGSEMEGRSGTTRGERKAAAYIADQFQHVGLKPGAMDGWLQDFYFFKDSVVGVEIIACNKTYEIGRDFRFSKLGNKENVKVKEIVFAGYGIADTDHDDFNGLDINGKAVLIFDGVPNIHIYSDKSGNNKYSRWWYVGAKVNVAKEKGAAAVLIIKDTINAMSINRLSLPYVVPFNDEIPTLYISPSMAAELMGISVNLITDKRQRHKLKVGSFLNQQINIKISKIRINTGMHSSNVLGFIEGTDKKNEFVFLTAHYDHKGMDKNGNIFYGADDNASGTAALIEISRAFSKAKAKGFFPKRSIVFMAISCEESGLLGSQYYIKNPIYPLAQTVVDLNIDMIGRVGYDYQNHDDSVNYIYTIGDDSLSSDLKQVSNSVNSKYFNLKLDSEDKEGYYKRSDHYNFAKLGIPVIFYTNGEHKDYHKITDTPDKINYDLLLKRTQLIFYTAWEIANRPERLKLDIEVGR